MDLWNIIILLYFIIYVPVIILVILLENKDPASTILWLLVVICLPIIGLIFYFYGGKRYSTVKIRLKMFKKKYRQKREKLIFEQQRLLKNNFYNKNDQVAGILNTALHGGFPYSTNNKTNILIDGKDTFYEIIKELKKAKHHIHIEMHILKFESEIGKEIKQVLIDKAKDGVKIRIVYDGIVTQIKNKDKKDLKKAKIEIKALYPWHVSLLKSRINHRTHRKIIIIDGNIGFTGGINVGDEYIHGRPELGKWHDVHLKIEGNAVYTIQTIFLSTWFFLTKQLITGKEYFPQQKIIGNELVSVVASGPDYKIPNIHFAYFNIITSAKNYLYIMVPYFTPDKAILTALITAAMKGIDIRILLPRMGDTPFVWPAARTNFGKLLKAGIKIYYYNGFTHGKVLLTRNIISIGSCNIEPRGFFNDFEMNAMIFNNPEKEKQMKELFERDFKNSKEVILTEFKKRPLWMKLKESLCRLFYPFL